MISRFIAVLWLYKKLGLRTASVLLIESATGNSKTHNIQFIFHEKKIKMRIESARTDIAMLTEVFCFEAYEIKFHIEPKFIVDAGANKGGAAIYFSTLYPDAIIDCFEPNDELHKILEHNLKINNVKATIVKKALSDVVDELSFIKDDNHQYSKLTDIDTGLKVSTTTLQSYYGDREIDILKLDIEGAEEVVVPQVADNVKVIIQEIHYDRVDFSRIISTLHSSGFIVDGPYPQYKWLNPDVEYPILLMHR
jgi:FkbM family methyltransferase